MKKIVTLEELPNVTKELQSRGKRIILAGGCFDILHKGHIAFLEKAKERGDTLIILLESDASIRKSKGEGKPVHTQKTRSAILASLAAVDYIVLLPVMTHDEYDKVVLIVKPAIIATTKGDPGKKHKERQAELVNAEVVDVIERLPDFASSELSKRITI